MTIYHAFAAFGNTAVLDGIDWRADWRGADRGWGNTGHLVTRCLYDPDDEALDESMISVRFTRMCAGYGMDDPDYYL